MNQPKGNYLRLMAKAENVKQADLARKLRKVQTESDHIKAQAGSVSRMLEEHGKSLKAVQTTAQLANSLRLGQQLEGFRNSLTLQRKQSELRLKKAKTDLAHCGHKLDILTEKARVTEAREKNSD